MAQSRAHRLPASEHSSRKSSATLRISSETRISRRLEAVSSLTDLGAFLRQGEVKTGALAGAAVRPHRSAMPGYDAVNDRQTQPDSGKILRAVKALEYPEESVGMEHVEAHPVIAHPVDVL